MPGPRKPVTQGRWRAIALSLLVHGLIVAAAVFGWFTWKHDPPPTTLAIDATVIDERELKGIDKLPEVPAEPPPQETPPEPVREPVPEPEPPPPEEQGPPKPDPAEIEKRQEEERLAQEKAEQEKQQLAREQEQARLDAEKKEAERRETERKEAEKKAAEKKKAEEAAAARKAAEEKARQAAEEELRRSLAAEERVNAARSSPEASRWHNSMIAKIERAWIKPATAVPGVTCIVLVKQVPGAQGGEVSSVEVRSCSVNDAALRESVEAAVYRASPLPAPPPGVPFERNLELTFAPTK